MNFSFEPPEVIFADDFFLVLNKPAGFVVNCAKTTTTQPVLEAWLRENYHYPIAKNFELRSGIVHRLDKETSGVILVAKTKEAFFNLQSQFKTRKVQKTYLALVHGEINPADGEINAPVGRLPWRRDRFGILPGGRDAQTKYHVLKIIEFKGEKFSLLKLNPKTGRTHQIRIHLKYLGHPVVSDNFYAGGKTARKDRLWCPRLFLHAQKISFFHPGTGKKLFFEADLPPILKRIIS